MNTHYVALAFISLIMITIQVDTSGLEVKIQQNCPKCQPCLKRKCGIMRICKNPVCPVRDCAILECPQIEPCPQQLCPQPSPCPIINCPSEQETCNYVACPACTNGKTRLLTTDDQSAQSPTEALKTLFPVTIKACPAVKCADCPVTVCPIKCKNVCTHVKCPINCPVQPSCIQIPCAITECQQIPCPLYKCLQQDMRCPACV